MFARSLTIGGATATRIVEERRAAIYADHSAKGCLQSGGTIRAVIRVMEETGAAFLTESIDDARDLISYSLAKTAECNPAFSEAILRLSPFCQRFAAPRKQKF